MLCLQIMKYYTNPYLYACNIWHIWIITILQISLKLSNTGKRSYRRFVWKKLSLAFRPYANLNYWFNCYTSPWEHIICQTQCTWPYHEENSWLLLLLVLLTSFPSPDSLTETFVLFFISLSLSLSFTLMSNVMTPIVWGKWFSSSTLVWERLSEYLQLWHLNLEWSLETLIKQRCYSLFI